MMLLLLRSFMIDAIFYLMKNSVFTIKKTFLLRQMQEQAILKLKVLINNSLHNSSFQKHIVS